MNIMVLDAEYNQPSGKTIQIGAAVFDIRSGVMVDRFQVYVNPKEPISTYITELTGIRDQDVTQGMSIQEAYKELKLFHKKHKCFMNPMVWGSGVSNDSIHIHKEAGFEEDSFMGRRVIDVKTIYQSIALFGNSQYSGGLETNMKKLGLEFEGTPHEALSDAINTFRVWHYLMKVFQDGKKK